MFFIVAFVLLILFLTNKTQFYLIGAGILILFGTFLLLVKWYKNKRRTKWHSDKNLLDRLKSLDPKDFEVYIADLYKKMGYSAIAEGGSHDEGIDVVLEKNNQKYYIQCKKYITSKVGVKELREFYGVLADKLAQNKGIFITTNLFTTEAENFAKDKPIELIDGHKLIKLIHQAGKEEDVPNTKEKCPECGSELVKKNGKYGLFWGCSNYPTCKFTKKL